MSHPSCQNRTLEHEIMTPNSQGAHTARIPPQTNPTQHGRLEKVKEAGRHVALQGYYYRSPHKYLQHD